MLHTPASFVPAHAAALPAAPAALAFAFAQAKLLVCGDERTPTVPLIGDLDRAGVPGERHYLGRLDGIDCIAITLADDAQPPAGMQFAGLRSLFLRIPEPILATAARAFQVVEWDRTHRFCGRCGSRTQDKEGERAKLCPSCGYTAYPRISPAMMVLVKRGEAILLARNIAAPPGRMSALAGFLEAGESVEEAIHREVREEVGVEVKDLRYFASQPWAFPHSLMLAFTAEYAGGELVLDTSEIVEAAWFGPGDPLPQLSPRQSISRALIEANLPRARP